MKIEMLGEAFWRGKRRFGAVLFGNKSLEELKNESVAIWGTGDFANRCYFYLKENGVNVEFFCDNDKNHWGKKYKGLDVIEPPKTTNAHFIICCEQGWTIRQLSRQILNRYGDNFSFFHVREFGDFFDNALLLDATMRSFNVMLQNEIVYGHKQKWYQFIEKYVAMTMPMELCQTTTYWDSTMKWIVDKDFTKPKSMLDVGPGWGLYSCILNDMYDGVDTTYISFSDENKVEDTFIDMKDKKYPVRRIYGYVEDPSFNLTEKYDLIIFTETLEHFSCNPIPTLKKIKNWLNKDGKLVLSTPSPTQDLLRMYNSYKELPSFNDLQRENYSNDNLENREYMDKSNEHMYIYSKQDLEEIFEECGLRVLKYELNGNHRHNYLLELK